MGVRVIWWGFGHNGMRRMDKFVLDDTHDICGGSEDFSAFVIVGENDVIGGGEGG